MNRFRLRALVAVVALFLAISSSLRSQEANKNDQKQSKTAVLIHLKGVIDPALEQFIYRKLDRAKAKKVDYVIIEIDSPGGYLEASFNLADRFRSTNWTTVVAYIPREALSGASVAALGCKEIVVAPDARFGDAGIIEKSIFQSEFRYAPEKVRSNIAQHLRILASAHQRPEALAEAFVDPQLRVFEYRSVETGKSHYFSSREVKNLDAAKWQLVGEVPESGDGRFLEVSGARAVELGLANETAQNLEQVLSKRRIEELSGHYQPGAVETVIRILNHPIVTAILFVGGLVALYFEFSAPGIGIGGAISALCFGLFFWSRFLGGTAGWLEVLLFAAGIIFLMIELFVLPGFGVLGFAGLGLIVVSLVLASQEFVVPRTPRDREHLALSLTVLVASGFIFLSCAVVITRHFGRLPVLSRLVLSPPTAAPEVPVEKPRHSELLQSPVAVGDIGVADSSLRPAGKAMFGDAYVDVVADGSFVDSGMMVRVVQISGNRVVVRQVEGKPPVA